MWNSLSSTDTSRKENSVAGSTSFGDKSIEIHAEARSKLSCLRVRLLSVSVSREQERKHTNFESVGVEVGARRHISHLAFTDGVLFAEVLHEDDGLGHAGEDVDLPASLSYLHHQRNGRFITRERSLNEQQNTHSR